LAVVLFYIWGLVNVLLLIYILQELLLVGSALYRRSPKIDTSIEFNQKVTIQLPLYNEKYVVKRLLNSVLEIDYPSHLLQVQILDDSTDETSDIIQTFLSDNDLRGIEVEHIQREDRSGYKAGALQYGMNTASGEFIAIFDADFIPDPKFLKATIPGFEDSRVGVVQTRWTFINKEYSLLTRAQAIMLNTHFSVEQLGRSNAEGFINFNGTAGVWRKTCIEDAGGWQADTLTEDLDLSFRAQSKGWKFNYLFDMGSPSELPVTFDAYRTQQFRWSKGAAECLRKNIKLLWRSNAGFVSKAFGSFHLLNSSVYILTFLLLMLSPFVFYFRQFPEFHAPGEFILSSLGTIVFVLLILIFFIGNLQCDRSVKSQLLFIPSVLMFFSMSMGISAFMVMGVIEGYIGKKSAFIRTPKFGSEKSMLSRVKRKYDFKSETNLRLLELLFLVYGGFWLFIGVKDMSPLVLVYALIISVGFSLSLFFKNKTFRWTQ
jgi:cellulose synthase/poly-beta-1,6-N-acetylglucosamine synthase-like glycosyltransferase